MPQLSFFSAEAAAPCVGDLAGLLCGPARMAGFARTAARLTVAVDERWRARSLIAALALRGVAVRLCTADDGRVQLHTQFRTDLAALADAWAAGTGKTAPPGLVLPGAPLRLWTLAAGRWLDGSYLLELDPQAPDTHEPVAAALAYGGLSGTILSGAGGGPGIKVSGRRRLARLAELVGTPPDQQALLHWPAVSRPPLMRTAP